MRAYSIKTLGLRAMITIATLFALCVSAFGKVEYNIVTGAETGTYFQFGRDLSKLVSPAAGISLNVIPTNGSVENIKRLRDEPGTKLALVQSDVFQAYLDEAANGNPVASRIVAPLRVVAPLYDEEVYALVRADSPLKYFSDMHGKRINIGPVGSGSAMTAATLYRRLFFTEIPAENIWTAQHEAALDKLARGSIDVALMVAGQPARLLSDMSAQQARQFRLLSYNPAAPNAKAVLQVYDTAKAKMSSYPSWLDADVDTISVRTLLVTYEYRNDDTKEMLTRFARSLCRVLPSLQSIGHDKWKQVNLTPAALKENWIYFSPTEQELRNCRNGEVSTSVPESSSCTQQEHLMGVCRSR